MGRVYDALKRAAENGAQNNGKDESGAARPNRGASERGNGHEPAAVRPTPERLFARSPVLVAPEAARISASAERTEENVGTALPGGIDSRVAGATVGAVGSARAAVEFASREVSAARVEPHLVAITQPHSPHSEQYRALRTRVLHAGERRGMQAFVITSANVMEGKTLTSLNLAWLLAQTDGVRALLIDADLRRPCATEYLGIEAPYGLSEVLTGNATLEDSILRLEPAGLHLLPGGAARQDVAELLSGPKWSAVVREARRMFDYIIIDAPPLAIFTDAAILINRADGALLVVRAGKTRYSTLGRLLEPIQRERLLGVVLNGAQEELNESNYYYQHRYRREEAPAEVKTEGAAEAV